MFATYTWGMDLCPLHPCKWQGVAVDLFRCRVGCGNAERKTIYGFLDASPAKILHAPVLDWEADSKREERNGDRT